ncbi:MAG: hypothetical protein Q8P59_15095 [Dehalococcoidia bacterium]|nr:hypothetical protein [Dehalococcoidia bacterium]
MERIPELLSSLAVLQAAKERRSRERLPVQGWRREYFVQVEEVLA